MDSGWLLGLSGTALGGALAFLGSWAGKHIDWAHADRVVRENEFKLAIDQERQNLIEANESIIKNLQAEVNRLWARSTEIQKALFECEKLHRQDAAKISRLELQNSEQASRITTLERRIPGIDSDFHDGE